MPTALLPDIGATGIYELKPPYQVLLKLKTSYSCQAVRKLNDVKAEGKDPFALYYDIHGVSKAVYDIDVENGVCIVSLQSGIGQWVHVPSSFILSFPVMNGISYRAFMLGVSLGALPDTLNLAALKTAVENLVTDTLGVTPVVKEMVISAPKILSKADHDLIEAGRQQQITISTTDAARLRAALTDLQTARDKITQLENYIRTNLV